MTIKEEFDNLAGEETPAEHSTVVEEVEAVEEPKVVNPITQYLEDTKKSIAQYQADIKKNAKQFGRSGGEQ